MRILYVEDNPANVFLVKRVAKVGNHEIINYIDGAEALRKFDGIEPDLILMDVQLSGELSGLDVVKQLRSRGVSTPIIAVTAYAMVGDKERCIEAGCTDYLAKPLPVPRLVEIFQEYSDASAAKAASAAPVEEAPAEAATQADETASSSATELETADDAVVQKTGTPSGDSIQTQSQTVPGETSDSVTQLVTGSDEAERAASSLESLVNTAETHKETASAGLHAKKEETPEIEK